MKHHPLWITGLVPAVFTPLLPNGRLHLAKIPAIVDHLIADGVSALYVCGGTGEGPSLSSAERMQVAEAYIAAAAGRLPVIVQVGHNSLSEARQLAAHAQESGAAAISAVPPSFYKINTLETLLDSLAYVLAGAPDLPFYFYHIPRLSGFNLDVVTFLEEGGNRLPTLHGIKYSTFTIFELQACVELANGRFNVLFGSDEMLLSGLVAGAQGAVGSTYNFATPLYKRVIAALEGGDLTSARRWQSCSVSMVRGINAHSHPSHNGSALKAMMAVIGLDCGPTRLPQPALPLDKIHQLHAEMVALGFFEWGSNQAQTAMLANQL